MLSLQNLRHVYGDGRRALDGVDLEVAPGFFGLLGPNGAGKSTLMRCVATLQEPTAGAVRFGDIDVRAEPERLRRTLGYLPQDFGVYPGVSARRMLDHMAVLKGLADRAQRREAVDGLLAAVNLWEARDRELARFSGGMRQRFGVAQALLGRPRLLVLDEPTAGLDPEERNRLLDLLAAEAAGAVVILSTHIVEDVADLCGRAAILAGGRVRLEGPPADMVAAVCGRLWSRLVDRAELPAIEAAGAVLSTRLVGGRVLVHALGPEPPGSGFAPAEPDLGDAYFATLAAARNGGAA